MLTKQPKKTLRQKRRLRIRSTIQGTAERPRFAVYRSNYVLYVQLIDDATGATLLARRSNGKNKTAAKELGIEVATAAKEKGIRSVVFDRGGFRYHGAIQEIAQAAREGGLKF